LLSPFSKRVLTITSDNGKEFSQHNVIAKELKSNFFFAHPYHSWERGLLDCNIRLEGLDSRRQCKKDEIREIQNFSVFIETDIYIQSVLSIQSRLYMVLKRYKVT
jgi:hypothetical protein